VASVDFTIASTKSMTDFTMAVLMKDEHGELLNPDAVISVKLWAVLKGDVVNRGELVDQWDNIKLDKGNFIDGLGVLVNVVYVNYKVDYTNVPGTHGFVEVTITQNGRSVSSAIKYVQLYFS
jgi:hypothetical protein